jgi:hypothetical protein
MVFRTGLRSPSKVLSSSVERGEKRARAQVVVVKGVRIILRQRDPRIQKACLFAALFFAKGCFSSIFVIQEYVYVDQA